MDDKAGYIKLYRKLVNWEWYDDINTCRLFLHLLITVNWIDGSWHGKIIKKGTRVTSYRKLAEETHLSLQNVRTSLNRLKSTQEITVLSNKTNIEITVIKYSDYQVTNCVSETLSNTQSNTEPTQSQHTANIKVTTIKEVLRSKELKELKNKTYIGVLSSYTSNPDLLETLKCFVDMRKAMKGYTVRALELNLKKLDKIAIDDNTKIGIVNQTIENSWKSFFPLKLQSQEKEVMPF